jgi:hypothetical protein
MSKKNFSILAAFATLALGCAGTYLDDRSMSFFISSVGSGNGADFGGLLGADRHCQSLAQAAGAGGRTWRAYLSVTEVPGQLAINARDRIGQGPWYNAKGVRIARNLDDLHGKNNLTKQTALTEKGEIVNGHGDKPNMHDILTGTRPDGTATSGDASKTTCGNWTMSGAGNAIVGHHDRIGLRDDEPSRSWNASHPSRGCALDDLRKSGGAGMIYCFAAN